ncbi:hypothetical protein PIB30_061423 [Stylosanthes scabra]|uniref:Uncharacterized protein n=1 Tax=Stylosanthes scabra TaxID=79078 RepID=A0ABU6XM94_9FABA|nr:hypothetical protein [Stylosanthes scabra]
MFDLPLRGAATAITSSTDSDTNSAARICEGRGYGTRIVATTEKAREGKGCDIHGGRDCNRESSVESVPVAEVQSKDIGAIVLIRFPTCVSSFLGIQKCLRMVKECDRSE